MPLLLAGVSLTFAPPALAQSVFDGTWKADIAAAKLSTKPNTFAIQGGVYRCSTCVPAYSIPADGQFHKVAGKDYWDEESATILDASSVRFVQRRGGKEVGTSTQTLSPDGATLTTNWSSNDTANGRTSSGVSTETRIAPAPAGAHALSGSWRADKLQQATDDNVTITFQTTPTTINVSFLTGEHYLATFGGPAVPVIGDPSGQMMAAKKLGPRAIELTSLHHGKVDSVALVTIAPDGRTGTYANINKRTGGSTSFPIIKQ